MALQTPRTSQEPQEEYIPPLDVTNVVDDANHEDLDREVVENDPGVCITTCTEVKIIKILISLGAIAAPAPV